MPNEPITGLPYPSGSDAPNGAAQILALVQALAGAAGWATPVLRAADAADRDTRYGGTLTPAGVIVVSAGAKIVWLKTGTTGTSADWAEVFNAADDTAIVTSGFTPEAGWTVGAENWTKVGKQAQCYLRLVRTGALIAGNTTGDVANIPLGAVPTGFVPRIPSGLGGNVATGINVGAYIWSDGGVGIGALPPGVGIATNDQITVGGSFLTV